MPVATSNTRSKSRAAGLPRPFLKWAGGKTQLADAIIARRPPSFDVYHEPFVGSGAVFFALVRRGLVRRAVLSDINWELIETFIAIRDSVTDVMAILAEFPYSRQFYYELRDRDPRTLDRAERAARMIYLNKTGYNGLYRVNHQGKFNVPFGRYSNPTYYDPETLLAASRALQHAELRCEPFTAITQRAQPGDWVYFDPPYVPVSETANFTAYQAGGFGIAEQTLLRDICRTLTANNVFVTLSNSDTPIVHQLYSTGEFHIERLQARRAINCNATRRGPVFEVLVTNVRPQHQ
jgi:DNA adenine methylase